MALGQWLWVAVVGTLSCGVCHVVGKVNQTHGKLNLEPFQAGKVEFCGAESDNSYVGKRPIWDDVARKFVAATVLNEGLLKSHHVILVLPVVPIDAGGEIVAQAFKSLPRKPIGTPSTSLTKVVLVGHSFEDGYDGITVGDDVCKSDLVDTTAARWFKDNTNALEILDPIDKPDCCPTKVNPTIDQQMPYLSMIFDEADPADPQKKLQTIKGNLLPIMIQKQSIELGSALGEAVADLIGPGGIYVKEKVLFVFTSDMSHNIKKKFTVELEKALVNTMTGSGFGPLVTDIEEIKKHDENPGGPEEFVTSAPYGYSSVVAAVKLAQTLKYRGAPLAITTSGHYEGEILVNGLEPCRGYATIMWTGSANTESDGLSSEIKQVAAKIPEFEKPEEIRHPGIQTYTDANTDELPKVIAAAPGPPKKPRVVALSQISAITRHLRIPFSSY